jgi:predicted metal-dependent HD superfamily phosphohydrolase
MKDPFKVFKFILETHVSSTAIQQLQFLWNEKHRHYHNITHLQQIITDIQNNLAFSDLSLVEKHTLLLAAFFHDSIYDPKKKDNEDRSIKFFKQSYIGKDAIMVEKVSKLIDITKYRKRPTEKLQRILWDADNAGFKKGFDHLLIVENNIRKEYPLTSNISYREGRIKFLESCIGLFDKKIDNDLNKLIEYVEKIYKS